MIVNQMFLCEREDRQKLLDILSVCVSSPKVVVFFGSVVATEF